MSLIGGAGQRSAGRGWGLTCKPRALGGGGKRSFYDGDRVRASELWADRYQTFPRQLVFALPRKEAMATELRASWLGCPLNPHVHSARLHPYHPIRTPLPRFLPLLAGQDPGHHRGRQGGVQGGGGERGGRRPHGACKDACAGNGMRGDTRSWGGHEAGGLSTVWAEVADEHLAP